MFEGLRPQRTNEIMHVAIDMGAANLLFHAEGFSHILQPIGVIGDQHLGPQRLGEMPNPPLDMERRLGL